MTEPKFFLWKSPHAWFKALDMTRQPKHPRTEEGMEPKFLTLSEVAQILNISAAQTYALVRNQSLRAIKIGGRGQYRVETKELEDFIKRSYESTTKFLSEHPFTNAS